MRKGILIIGILLTLVATSCSEYQKVLKSEDTALKYAAADSLYKQAKEEDSNKKFRKAVRLLEQFEAEFRGKPQGQRVSFMLADSHYQLGDHFLAPFEFERFLQLYPQSEKAEEAAYKMAVSYYERSPRYYLDQTDTHKGMEQLQAYLTQYPEGEFSEDASAKVLELQVKLEEKAYEIAKQYHHTETYKAAIASFDNFIGNYPGSPFMEKAYYYRFDSAYRLAINSFLVLMPDRLKEGKEYYDAYKKNFPEGEFTEQVEEARTDIENRLQNI